MNPDNFKIDSPSPELAMDEIGRYYELLEPAFEHTLYTFEEMSEDVESGHVLLIRIWENSDLAAVSACKVRHIPEGLDLYVMALVGDGWPQWFQAYGDVLVKLANETDCAFITLDGRPGFQKLIASNGYKVHQVVMRKDLRSNGDGRHRPE